MKKNYIQPLAEKFVFNYSENVGASGTDQTDVGPICTPTPPGPQHGDVGHGVGQGGGCDHVPGHGTPKTDHPVFGNGCD